MARIGIQPSPSFRQAPVARPAVATQTARTGKTHRPSWGSRLAIALGLKPDPALLQRRASSVNIYHSKNPLDVAAVRNFNNLAQGTAAPRSAADQDHVNFLDQVANGLA